jgi:uncharacterized membrane protein
VFEFLFKYPAADFAAGEVVSLLSAWQLALLPLVLAAGAYLLLGTFRLRGRVRTRDRVAVSLLRGGALAIALFSLSQPLLEVSSATPQPSLVAVLLDNSVSMRLAHTDGDARGDYLRREFDPTNGGLLRELQHRVDTRLFRFGAATRPVADVAALDFADGASDLAQALGYARDALRGEPLAGLVVISDGATGTGEALDARLLELRSAGIPVYPVGVGETAYPLDIEIARVHLPSEVLQGSQVMAEVSLRQRGYDNEAIELIVEDESRILHKQTIQLRAGLQTLRVPLETIDAGARRLEFRVEPRAGERIAANNRRVATLEVDDRHRRILYFEGEPRFEMKFLRRAVADDEQLRVTGLIRTADAKYYRVGIEHRGELRDGFPSTRDELFAYDAVILGSVDISLLEREQQRLLVDFVGERGGSLLMLGGRHAFTEGGYRDSLLHDLSPVVMPDHAAPGFKRSLRIEPTAAAWVHPALKLADANDASIERWQTLPPLDMVNPVRRLKPGATLLLRGASGADEEPYVALAWQRYGRGKAVAFPVQNSWLWQMHQDIDLEDQTHERLWRQLLRWLVEGVPQRLRLELTTNKIHAGGSLGLRAEALNPDYTPLANVAPRAVVTAPNGIEQVLPFAPHPTLPGIFEASLALTESGEYRARLELDDAEGTLRGAETRFGARADGDEYFRSELNQALLQRIADATGGRYFAAGDTGALAGLLADNLRSARALERRELWDLPILFLLLATLLCAEWAYRRWRGLP